MSFRLKEIQEYFALDMLGQNAASSHAKIFSTSNDKLQDRLAIYRGNLRAIWAQTLANAYPVVKRLVGDEFFEELARAYGRQYPSQSGDLNEFGEHFPQFLRGEPAVAEYPYFSHVADLEWLLHRSYYAADAPILGLPELIGQAGDRVQQVKLQIHPAAAIYHSPMASVEIWLNHQHDEVLPLEISVQTESYAMPTISSLATRADICLLTLCIQRHTVINFSQPSYWMN